MGKGDKRSVKGKRVLGTFGVVRPRRSQKATAKTSKKS
ncbi:MAG: 30S ribosomal protein THX [Bacteroidetes bacterium MED-G17]|nr:MAG: 30S ribosomal protein THX [Bacteroidetes bacterium TMED39]PDH53484.1 MAG: 30S ribosomal protein THX [Bacteroidetes bacterium MED-G17]|tara:strand:- start:3554 stop:3667 length:114 start_codon:yes stop_codon:yes gene_type:complete